MLTVPIRQGGSHAGRSAAAEHCALIDWLSAHRLSYSVGGGEDPPWSGPVVLTAALDELDADGPPGAAHRPMLSDRRGFQRGRGVVVELLRAMECAADPFDLLALYDLQRGVAG